MAAKTSFLKAGDQIAAGSTFKYGAVIKDENGVAVPAASISALTLSIVVTGSDPAVYVNTVHDTNILNADRGTVDTLGNLVITLTPADTALTVATDTIEYRSLIIVVTYGGGKKLPHEVEFAVIALSGT